MKRLYLLIVPFFITLNACGGSSGDGSSGSDTPASTINNGVFIDSRVEGLEFSTSTQNGVTNANGEFQYQDGENVTFSLYGQPIAEVPGYDVLTPFDNSDDTVHPDYPINLLRFMQTLDTDADAANGITLPVVSVTMNVNFDQNMADFENDANVVAFISDNTNVTTLTVTPANAVNHFNDSVANVTDDYVLDLAGKTVTSIITPGYCTNNITGGFTYEFNETSFTMTGSDQFNSTDPNLGPITCSLGPETVQNFTYVALPSDFSFYCGPVCTYSELNRLSEGVDIDGRDHITSVWHTPNSTIVTETKRILSGPLFNFIGAHTSTEVYSFN
jgi:hypothetical protein